MAQEKPYAGQPFPGAADSLAPGSAPALRMQADPCLTPGGDQPKQEDGAPALRNPPTPSPLLPVFVY